MGAVWVDSQSLTDIADAIRAKNGESGTYLPSEMAGKITDLPTGNQKYTYHIATSSTSGSAAKIRVDLLQNNVVKSSTTYTHSESRIYHVWFAINNLKIGYGMNNDYKWYVACNSNSVKYLNNLTNYTAGQAISNWSYQDWKDITVIDN